MKASGRYHGKPVIRSLSGQHEYEILQRPDDWFGYLTSDGVWLIPRPGQHTDMGSIPRPLWPLVAPDAFWAFYFHDDLYANHSYVEYWPDLDTGLPDIRKPQRVVQVTRAQADAWMREGAYVEGGRAYVVGPVYHSVRMCGWLPWRRSGARLNKQLPSGAAV